MNQFKSNHLMIFSFCTYQSTDSSNLLGLSTFVIAVICFVVGLCIIYYLICPASKRGAYFISRSNLMTPSYFSRTSMMSSFLSAVPSFSSVVSRTDRGKKRYERSAWRKKMSRDLRRAQKQREIRPTKVEESKASVLTQSELVRESDVKRREHFEEPDKISEVQLDKEQDKDQDKNIKEFSKATGISYLWSPSK